MSTDKQTARLISLRDQIRASIDGAGTTLVADCDWTMANAAAVMAARQAQITDEHVQARLKAGHWRRDWRPFLVDGDTQDNLMEGTTTAITVALVAERDAILALTDDQIRALDTEVASAMIDSATFFAERLPS
jgi:hypothetical protein